MEEINWDSLLLEPQFPDIGNILESEPDSVTESPPQPLFTQNPDEEPGLSSWIGEIEKALMEDDQFDDRVENQPASDDFLADLLVDSPPSGSDGAIDDASFHIQNQTHVDNNDPIAKRQKRMLRNRDAAMRSRERKKMYVKDLEMKSRYLEGECRRLSRMLQCFIAENQALRLTLHKGCAFDASSAKQESAVLLLESLLLGSLLWFLGIMCLFTLPALPKSLLEAVPLAKERKRGPERVAPRGAGSNQMGQYFVKSRRCKASRTKMKDYYVPEILVPF